MSIFSNRLKNLRKAHNLTQSALGELVGASPRQISFYEGGSVQPSLDMLLAIANHLDTTADYLLGITDNPTRDPNHTSQLNPTQQELYDLIDSYDEDFQRKLLAAIKLFTE